METKVPDAMYDPADAIIAARYYGIVHCGISSLDRPSLSELAIEFGLDGNALYREIGFDAARQLVPLVLGRDMAYDNKAMPAKRARELADLFLDQFGVDGAQFFTNCTFDERRGPLVSWRDVSWISATNAICDAGVLIISPRLCGCLWVEDDD